MTTNATRRLVEAMDNHSRGDMTYSAELMQKACVAIDTLLDVIEMQRGPAVPQRTRDLQHLQNLYELRGWHRAQRDSNEQADNRTGTMFHANAVTTLNAYFPKDDQL